MNGPPKFLSSPSDLFKSPNSLSILAIFLEKSLHDHLCRLGTLKKKNRVVEPDAHRMPGAPFIGMLLADEWESTIA